jgi:hypothetical protein
MYQVTIDDPSHATEAIHWCKKNIKETWKIDTKWPSTGFVFSFYQQKDASWFSLHWTH